MKANEKDLSKLNRLIADKLSRDVDASEANILLLSEICKSLGLDASFIYTRESGADHEVYIRLDVGLFQKVDLPTIIDENDIFREAPPDSARSITPDNIEATLFGAFPVDFERCPCPSDCLLIFPILEARRIIGFVGLLSKGGVMAAFSEEERTYLKVICALVAANVKARFFKQKSKYAMESIERAIDNAGIDIYVTDFYTDEILYVNKSMAAPYGGVENMMDKICYIALYDNQFEECDYCPKYRLIDENGNPSKLYSWEYRRPFDGSWFRVFSAAFKWEEDRLAHVITSIDITESKNAESTITKMALIDALTDIPNRRSFGNDFDALIERTLEKGSSGYVLFVDLDNFKHINDAFGHEKGDELLKAVASYLNSFSSTKQQAYRYGGDEFIILMEEIGFDSVCAFIDILLFRFTEPWDLDGLEYFCTASIGAACFPQDGTSHDTLLNAADTAMYEAKKRGKSTVAFSSREASGMSAVMEMEFALRRAIQQDDCSEFELLFHPIVDIHTGDWVGTEALVRWNSQQFGLVYPDTFIPMCEKLGLIFEMEKWTLSTAIREVIGWNLPDEDDFFLSLNVSALEFQGDSFNDYLTGLVRDLDYPPTRLMLEIIEGTPNVSFKVEEIRHQLDDIRKGGVLVALDGFGIGHDSLERIQELNVDFIKIDRNFVTDSLDDELKTAVVKAIIMLAKAVRARVSAEGVESAEHVAHLKEIGCDYVQGIYFSKPVTGEKFREALLENRARKP